jgi:hypothetical protein
MEDTALEGNKQKHWTKVSGSTVKAYDATASCFNTCNCSAPDLRHLGQNNHWIQRDCKWNELRRVPEEHETVGGE